MHAVKVAKTAIDVCHAAQAFWKKTPNGKLADGGVFRLEIYSTA
jgi:hypothetical protein